MTNWTPLSDDNPSDMATEVFESLSRAMVEYSAGEATATPKDANGKVLGVVSVADLDGLFVGVHIDLQGEDTAVVWAYKAG